MEVEEGRGWAFLGSSRSDICCSHSAAPPAPPPPPPLPLSAPLPSFPLLPPLRRLSVVSSSAPLNNSEAAGTDSGLNPKTAGGGGKEDSQDYCFELFSFFFFFFFALAPSIFIESCERGRRIYSRDGGVKSAGRGRCWELKRASGTSHDLREILGPSRSHDCL